MAVEIEDMSLKEQEKQVITKKRVSDHGEVLTAKREVNAMLDLVKQETECIDSRFLEPACGTGNFMTEILERKLRVVENRHYKSQLEYERNAVLAVASIYGIDLLEDNVVECRKRLFDIFDQKYASFYKRRAKDACRKTVKYILERNIIYGDALTLKMVGDNTRSIIFSEWSLVKGSMLKRRDFTFQELLEHASWIELPMFSDIGGEAFVPKPVKEYPLIHYLRVADVE